MKADLILPQELVNEIADRVAERIIDMGIDKVVINRLKPLLSANGKADSEVIFTPKSLAEYLQVDDSWVYKQVSLKAIPYFKSGKYTRFKKSAIDRWIETQTVRPVSPLRKE